MTLIVKVRSLEDIFRETITERDNAFPPLTVPPFKEFEIGEWKLRKGKDIPLMRGYFSGLQPGPEDNWYLKDKDKIWMSVTPMELESQAHHAVAAKGAVIVGGFGMGVLVWNIAQKPGVTSITVLERDPHVIQLANYLMGLEGWENVRLRTRIIEADALEWRSIHRYSVVLMDIWPSLGAQELRPDMVRVVQNIRALEYGAWGMELDFVTWLIEQDIPATKVEQKHWRKYSQAIGVPLIMRKHPHMAKLALRAAMHTYLS